MKRTAKSAAEPRWLTRLEQAMPQRLRWLELFMLAQLTARALGEKAPALRGCSAEESLGIYRAYTVRILQNRPCEELNALRMALYQKAYSAGRLLARLPGIRKDEAKRRLIFLLYRNIGITLEGDLPGLFCVPHCSFSKIYTPQTCYVMSGMDTGLICGMFGGGSLAFHQRLTEGHKECRAVFHAGAPLGNAMPPER